MVVFDRMPRNNPLQVYIDEGVLRNDPRVKGSSDHECAAVAKRTKQVWIDGVHRKLCLLENFEDVDRIMRLLGPVFAKRVEKLILNGETWRPSSCDADHIDVPEV